MLAEMNGFHNRMFYSKVYGIVSTRKPRGHSSIVLLRGRKETARDLSFQISPPNQIPSRIEQLGSLWIFQLSLPSKVHERDYTMVWSHNNIVFNFTLTLGAALAAAFLALGFPREKVMLISLNPATEEIRRAETASFMVDVFGLFY